METICLKIEENLLNDIDNSIKQYRYSARTEFIRDAVRSKLSELEKEQVISKLAKLKGSLKGKARLSDKEAAEKAGS